MGLRSEASESSFTGVPNLRNSGRGFGLASINLFEDREIGFTSHHSQGVDRCHVRAQVAAGCQRAEGCVVQFAAMRERRIVAGRTGINLQSYLLRLSLHAGNG